MYFSYIGSDLIYVIKISNFVNGYVPHTFQTVNYEIVKHPMIRVDEINEMIRYMQILLVIPDMSTKITYYFIPVTKFSVTRLV